MEHGLTEQLIVHRLHALQHSQTVDGIIAPRACSAHMQNVLRQIYGDNLQELSTGAVARSQSVRFNRGDVALAMVDGVRTAGDIFFFFSEAAMGTCVCFSVWTFIATDGSTSNFLRFEHQTQIRILPLRDLLAPVTYRKGDKFAIVHVPQQLREHAVAA